MKVISLAVPDTLLIQNALPKIDFSDCFATTNHKDNLETISKMVFDNTPKWITALLKFRNNLVKPLGLKYEKPADYNTEFKIGGYVGFFKIYTLQENEVILGADDKHLNFRVSILIDQSAIHNIKVTTLVEYNNKMGKWYMAIVAPFHRIVVKYMVKQAYVRN